MRPQGCVCNAFHRRALIAISAEMIAVLDASEGQIWLNAGNPEKALTPLESIVHSTYVSLVSHIGRLVHLYLS
jgi:hypothetical protein